MQAIPLSILYLCVHMVWEEQGTGYSVSHCEIDLESWRGIEREEALECFIRDERAAQVGRADRYAFILPREKIPGTASERSMKS